MLGVNWHFVELVPRAHDCLLSRVHKVAGNIYQLVQPALLLVTRNHTFC